MRGQVPDHVHVVLEQTEVDPGGIVIVELAQRIFLQQLLDLAHRTGKQKGVVHHDLQVLPGGQIDQLFGLRGIAGERFLDEDVLAVFERGFGEFEVGPDRRNDGYGVDVRRGDHFVGIGV